MTQQKQSENVSSNKVNDSMNGADLTSYVLAFAVPIEAIVGDVKIEGTPNGVTITLPDCRITDEGEVIYGKPDKVH